jgi:hypothetical protein
VLILGLTAAFAVGNAQPVPNNIRVLHLDAWTGLTLNKKVVPDIFGNMQKVFAQSGYTLQVVPLGNDITDSCGRWVLKTADGKLTDTMIELAGYCNSIGYLSIYNASRFVPSDPEQALLPTLGDVVRIYGPPNCVVILPGDIDMRLEYYDGGQKSGLTVYAPQLYVAPTWTTQISGMTYFTGVDQCETGVSKWKSVGQLLK